MISKKLLFSSTILSLPGLISIFVSLLAIPIHLKIAGIENYGNYIMFHLLLTISFLFNLGISKSSCQPVRLILLGVTQLKLIRKITFKTVLL